MSIFVNILFSAKSISSNGFRGLHSLSTTVEHCNMKVQILPALQDNYMYLVSIVLFKIIFIQFS